MIFLVKQCESKHLEHSATRPNAMYCAWTYVQRKLSGSLSTPRRGEVLESESGSNMRQQHANLDRELLDNMRQQHANLDLELLELLLHLVQRALRLRLILELLQLHDIQDSLLQRGHVLLQCEDAHRVG